MTIHIVSAYDEYGETDPVLGKAAYNIARGRSLGITSDRVLQYVAMDQDQVVGGVWVAFDGDNYEFDVAVASGHERQGIGRKLTQAALAERAVVTEGYDDHPTTMLVPVTSWAMCRLLEKEGFIITDVPAKGFFTMGLKDECEPFQKPHPDMDLSNWLKP